jgi:MFS family permease
MLVEVALLQRLTVFLGHPTYSLTTILFSLLIAGGLGSFLSGRLPNAGWARLVPLIGLLAAIILVGIATVPILRTFEASGTWQRLVVAAGLVGSVGVFMGMALPTGMRVAAASASELIPWLWGINGATSVLGSVLGAAIALAYGISTSYWVGVMCYAWAVAALALKWRRDRTEALETESGAAKAPAIGIGLIRPLDARRLQTAE